MIIPFFIPHSGCPHQCVFCNQHKIIGRNKQIDADSFPRNIQQHLDTYGADAPVQVAFYGGSFTSLSREIQETYLSVVQPFIISGQIESIRISTRPDSLTNETLDLLKKYHVRTVELGAQSMDDHVLTLSGRGHTATDTIKAVSLLKSYGFIIGLQFMLGLPGDSTKGFLATVEQAIELKPDFVRIYPALVIKDTPLEILYTSGTYLALSLDDAVQLCKQALARFEQANIAVIRVGLQPTEELERPGTILAGPYHPAFRQLVEASLFLDRMRKTLKKIPDHNDMVTFLVNPKDVSSATGQKKTNISRLVNEFNLRELRIQADDAVQRGTVRLV